MPSSQRVQLASPGALERPCVLGLGTVMKISVNVMTVDFPPINQGYAYYSYYARNGRLDTFWGDSGGGPCVARMLVIY
jgi:hypothetical protein